MNILPIKPRPTELQAIIFDMDDTMVKTMQTHFSAWCDLCLKHNPKNLVLDKNAGVSAENIERVKNSYNGYTSEEFVERLFGQLPKEKVRFLADEREDLFIKQAGDLKEINGLTNFLEAINDIPKAIASSTSLKGIQHVLDKLSISHFFESQNIIDPSKVLRGKPAPDPFLAAAESLGVSPSNCLVFEDSAGGIKAAKDAGMTVIGVATSIPKERLLQLGASRAINDYTEIKHLNELENVFNVMV